ncbi:hypothetical protein [Isachenkonia alkalipeptolytica]|uniref:Uncharacterized protein n=1 Tax=Isachenkonia alkalipeptolytica TaxID=2565777 RepID=A0AA44BDT6_9CLOT|nr:hypothetical protein [Isachenkonia alkalipeptolytica]NBG88634.1 hypothetical protein [Isachenkonia alkalipeptolytica]
MEYPQSFGKTFKSEMRKSKPYLILGTVMYLITVTVAYGILSTFQGATFSFNSTIIFTALRDYLIIPGIILLFSFTKTLWNTRRKKIKDS